MPKEKISKNDNDHEVLSVENGNDQHFNNSRPNWVENVLIEIIHKGNNMVIKTTKTLQH